VVGTKFGEKPVFLGLRRPTTKPLVTFFALVRPTLHDRRFRESQLVPPKRSATLTEAELRLMEVLWQRGPSTVQQVLDGLPGDKPLAYNSVLTIIRILERKGYVAHAKDGRAYVYAPLVERSAATRSEVRHLVQRLFQNSHELLVLNILEDSGLSEDELQRLKQYLRERE
jgi:BlaI family transcriptional regulator, penicillinase repressor